MTRSKRKLVGALLKPSLIIREEDLIDMDGAFTKLKEAAVESVKTFGERLRSNQARRFIEIAREQPHYPYREGESDPVTVVKKAVFDVALERLNSHANIEGMSKKQQAVLFQLLARANDNEDLFEIVGQIVKLSDEDLEKFKEVLDRTTLESIIKLSSEVTSRLHFLDVLHELVYGDLAPRLRERSQLHKILEPHCWLFGPRFHLAASDKGFREVVRKHRAEVGLPRADEGDLKKLAGGADIPDLFLAATRDFPSAPKHHHLLVELKAPSVVIAQKEIEQIRRYASTILQSPQFEKTSTRWDLFVVSSAIHADVEFQRQQKDKPVGLILEHTAMNVWVVAWSEIITRAKEEMQLVREHLTLKSTELNASGYLQQKFPEIFSEMKAQADAKRRK